MNKTASLPNEMYFITMVVVGWVDLFTRAEYCDFIIENLDYCQQKKNLEIYEYVIMSNHIHLICRGNDIPLSNIIRDLKSYTSKELIKMIISFEFESRKSWMIPIFESYGKQNPLNEKYQLWQNLNSPTLLDNPYIYDQKAQYIHDNPVKAGIVTDPTYYYYSSANPESPLNIYGN